MGACRRAGDAVIFDVSHRTAYTYGHPVLRSEHLVHLTPRSGPRQTVHRHSLLIEPAPTSNSAVEDYFGNASAVLTIDERHSAFVIQARSTVEVHAPVLPAAAATTPWEQVPPKALGATGGLDMGVLQYVSASRHTGAVRAALDYARPSFAAGRPILEAALDLTQRIHRDFIFDGTATDISTPVAHVLKQRRGVCQDFAHLALTCLRALRLPARYVSGYLLTYPPPGAEKLRGADASHAWVSVWMPEAGWVDLDPTNGLLPAGEHIAVAWGRDFADVSPVSGVLLGGGRQRLEVSVDVAVAG
jgi:transglutaminase-like putative cysteine protease